MYNIGYGLTTGGKETLLRKIIYIIYRDEQQVENWGRIPLVESWGGIPYSETNKQTPFFTLTSFHWVDEAHLHYAGESLRQLIININHIHKISVWQYLIIDQIITPNT